MKIISILTLFIVTASCGSEAGFQSGDHNQENITEETQNTPENLSQDTSDQPTMPAENPEEAKPNNEEASKNNSDVAKAILDGANIKIIVRYVDDVNNTYETPTLKLVNQLKQDLPGLSIVGGVPVYEKWSKTDCLNGISSHGKYIRKVVNRNIEEFTYICD